MTNVSTNPIPTPAISAEARAYLAQALNLDLIGPPANHELAEERIPGWVRPSNWYLTGFLVPTDAPPEQSADADEEDELDETPATTAQTVTSPPAATATTTGTRWRSRSRCSPSPPSRSARRRSLRRRP